MSELHLNFMRTEIMFPLKWELTLRPLEDTLGNTWSVTTVWITTMSLANDSLWRHYWCNSDYKRAPQLDVINFFHLQDPFVCVRVNVNIMKKHSTKRFLEACAPGARMRCARDASKRLNVLGRMGRMGRNPRCWGLSMWLLHEPLN